MGNKQIGQIEIEKVDVQKVLSSYQGSSYFQKTLDQSTEQDIAPTVIKYVYFNRLFGAGVAYLSSQLALQTSLFKDSNETSELWNDRSMEVGACVFAAAIDEFGDRGLPSHPTHRAMAQAVMKGVSEYAGNDIKNLDLNYINSVVDPKVQEGYGVNIQLDERTLFRSIGFHIGSELLADEEFRILDTTLRRKYPDLVISLENKVIKISGEEIPAYRWIGIHTIVEIDHFAHAVRAANVALKFYSGSQEKGEVRKQILEGVKEFASFQQKFMQYLHQGEPTLQNS